MFHEFFSQSKLLVLPVIGLILSFLAFVAIVVRMYLGMRRGESVDHLAALPLEEDGDAGQTANRGRARIQ